MSSFKEMHMNKMLFVIAPLTAFTFGISGAALAADPSTSDAAMPNDSSQMPAEIQNGNAPRMGHMPQVGMHERGMMGGGMTGGMMGMMGACPMMNAGSGANAKVMMQMHGEMLRAMGEIMMKYADKFEMPSQAK
jgi:hypothetical protein